MQCISFHTDIFGILNSSKGLFIAFLHGKNRNEAIQKLYIIVQFCKI